MHAYIVPTFIVCRLMLLSASNKVRICLNNSCWFNVVNELEKDTSVYSECIDNEFAANWSRLWCSAGKLYNELCHGHAQLLKTQRAVSRPCRLAIRKRYELAFLFRISSLHQLMICLHASGDSGDTAMQQVVLPRSTMRFSAIVLFLLPQFSPIRRCYVYRLCCSLPDGRRPYLHGCGSA